jgi:hypothetical protein
MKIAREQFQDELREMVAREQEDEDTDTKQKEKEARLAVLRVRDLLEILRYIQGRLYWRFCGNIVADDHRSSATMLPQNLQYNMDL